MELKLAEVWKTSIKAFRYDVQADIKQNTLWCRTIHLWASFNPSFIQQVPPIECYKANKSNVNNQSKVAKGLPEVMQLTEECFLVSITQEEEDSQQCYS